MFNNRSLRNEVSIAGQASPTTADAVKSTEAPDENKNNVGALGGIDFPASTNDQGIIKNASIGLTVKRGLFNRIYDQIVEITKTSDGYVAGSNSSAYNDDLISGTITVKVPTNKFEASVSKFRRLGKLTSLSINSDDVSTEMIDLNSRLRNWRSQETVLLKLMDKANTIADSIAIQQQLSQVQQEIERISGRLKYLESQTSYSTISVNISEPGAIPGPTDPWGIKNTFEQAAMAFMNSISGLILLIGFLGPYVILGLVVYIVIRGRNRHNGIEQIT